MSKRKELASASINNVERTPLNDDGWSTFIMSLIFDEEGNDDINVSKSPLFELISSGIRQKFSVIQKADLISWAIVNSKSYDICKEVKAIVESSSAPSPTEVDFPNALIAKLLKVRLLIFKEDGLEKKAAALKAAAEASESANQTESDPKKAAANAKKEPEKKDDRVKSSPKKPTKGATGKPNESSSRPESANAQTEANSKRKNKLREKGSGKGDAKPSALSDEPLEGPDAYYILQGFESIGSLSAMIEEIELPIHAIIRVTGSPQDVSRINPAQLSNLAATNSSLQDSESIKSLNFIVEDYPNYTQSKNPLIVGILEQIKNSSETSLWRQVAWGDVFASNSKDYKDVFDMLAHSSYTILEKRKVHQSFYAYMPQISIPVVEKGSLSKIDLKYYDHLFTEIGSERAVDSDLILSLLLEHICRVVMIMDASGNNGASNTASSLSQTEEIGVLEYHLEQQIDRLGSTLRETHLGTHTFHPDFGVAESSLNGDVSNHGDDHSIFSKHLEGLTAFDIQSKEILKNLRSAYPAAKFSRLLSSAFSQVSPEILMKIEQEQTLLRAELGRFVHMTQSQLRRTLLQFEFENLIGCTDGTTNLNEYCWVESLSPSAMTQVLENALIFSKNTRAKYSVNEGSILVAVQGTGNGRGFSDQRLAENTREDVIRTKLGFALWNDLLARGKKELISENFDLSLFDEKAAMQSPSSTLQPETSTTPPKIQAKSSIYLASDKVMQYEEINTTMYGSDGCRVETIETTSMCSGNDYRVRMSWNDNVLSWANQTKSKTNNYFTIATKGNYVINVFEEKRSDNSSVVRVQGASPDGMHFEFLENGNICLKRFSSKPSDMANISAVFMGAASGNSADQSSSRICTPSGLTMVYGADNSMFAYNIDGSKHILNANKTWTSTKQDGQRVITDLSAQVLETLTSTRATREYHPALASLLISREDFVNIKMEGILPSENNEEPATLRPSLCRADFGDGTSIESSYETDGALSRITVDQSTYGKLVFHNDGISCDLIFEDGIIIEKRTRPSGGVEFAVKMTDSVLVINHDGEAKFIPGIRGTSGAHHISWKTGTYRHEDEDGSVYEIDSNGEAKVNRSSSFDVVAPFYDISAGSVVNSLVSHFSQQPQPNLTAGSSDILFNAPRLFVVSKDGSGIELHRDKGLYLYFRERIHSKSSEIIEETLFGEAGSVCVTLLTESDDTNIMKERSSKNIVFRQLVRHPRLTDQQRGKIEADILSYMDMKNALHESSQNISAQLDQLMSNTSVSQGAGSQLILGADKASTEEAIQNKFKLKQIAKESITSYRQTDSKSSSVQRGIMFSRPRILVSKDRRQKSEHKPATKNERKSTSSPRHTPGYTKTESVNEYNIPKYFESEEGVAFLRTNPNGAALVKPARRHEELFVIKTINTLDDDIVKHIDLYKQDGKKGLIKAENKNHLLLNPSSYQSKLSSSSSHSSVGSDAYGKSQANPAALQFDLLGLPREEAVNLPKSLLGSKPGAQPNTKYIEVEAETRRKLSTASTAMLMSKEYVSNNKTLTCFEAIPSGCFFGTVKQGYKYRMYISLTNIGNDSARFKIRQPSTESGATVRYQPGPVAPGMKLKVLVELDARSATIAKKSKEIKTTFQVVTEAEVLHIPISAVVFDKTQDAPLKNHVERVEIEEEKLSIHAKRGLLNPTA